MHQRTHQALFRTALLTLAVALVASVLPTAAFAQPRGEQFMANLVDPAGHFGRAGGSSGAVAGLVRFGRSRDWSGGTTRQRASQPLAQLRPAASRRPRLGCRRRCGRRSDRPAGQPVPRRPAGQGRRDAGEAAGHPSRSAAIRPFVWQTSPGAGGNSPITRG